MASDAAGIARENASFQRLKNAQQFKKMLQRVACYFLQYNMPITPGFASP